MKFKSIAEVILTAFLLSVLNIPFNAVPVGADPSTTVFLDPPTIKDKVISETVTVNINVSNVDDLYGWQAGMTFNPDVLNCTGYYEGEFLKRGLDPENPNEGTWWIDRHPPWDNPKGVVIHHACCRLGSIPGVDGSGQLGYLTFDVIGTGISDLHLTDVILIGVIGEWPDYDLFEISFEVIDVFTVSWGGVDYSVETTSNLTGIWGGEDSCSGLFYHAFTPEEKTVTFNVTTPYNNFYDITIPKAILSCGNLSDWTVKIDGLPKSFVATESPTETSLYFTYHNSSHKVEVTGTVIGKPGDLNDDGKVTISDIVIIALAFGSQPGDPTWNAIADLNGDGKITISDVVIAALHFGAVYT